MARRLIAPGTALLAILGMIAQGGCSLEGLVFDLPSEQPVEPPSPAPTEPDAFHPSSVERIAYSSVEKIDLILAIDNSRTMADKQEVLALAVPDLVRRLVNPDCVDPYDSSIREPVASPTDMCPPGLTREFEPVLDIHIGVLSSSIGGYGSDACAASSTATQSNNDRGHLLARTAADQRNDLAGSTYQGKLFLAWDPEQKLDGMAGLPGGAADGEADIDTDSSRDANTTALVPVLSQMVRGVGQVGCGYEAQMETWYRFLADPEPYETISVVNGQATPQGIDTELLSQRADFLRPDSLLAIIMLTDENDCSVRESGEYYLAAQQTNANGSRFHLPRARAVCATNPNDECCTSCSQAAPDSCGVDPTCYVNGDPAQGTIIMTDWEDAPNLRCFDQKRRLGIDFLYPIDRYTQALTSIQIQNRAGEIVGNPIFQDLDPNDSTTGLRDPGLVFFTGIVGVPWQDIARDPNDLSKGIKSPEELAQPVGNLASTWELILGNPADYQAPADPFMIETYMPRTGTNPITGDAITAPGSGTTNNINGSEYSIPDQDDLQYACIFPLPPGTERDCSVPGTPACDCETGTDNPLCDAVNQALQIRAKAYPGLRELSLIRSLGSQGIPGSVCPAQLTDASMADFGYRPAISALFEQVKPIIGGRCLQQSLATDADGQVACKLIEARATQGSCSCDSPSGRHPLDADDQAVLDLIAAGPASTSSGLNCFCELTQLAETELIACQLDALPPVQTSTGEDVHGWCYIDADSAPPIGAPELVVHCPTQQKRMIRFAGNSEPLPGSTVFLACDDP